MIVRKINSLYVHIPFCKAICHYCDFCKVYYNQQDVDLYLVQLHKEILKLPQGSFKTVYIGGGTPVCLNYNQMRCLFEMLESFISKDTVEYCIEVNPEMMDEQKVKLCKQFGVNRMSIGVQTFDDHLLHIIGRKHRYQDIVTLVAILKRNQFDNISFDMMYGLPGQTLEQIQYDLHKISLLDIQHVSYYSLILEENTIFHHKKIQPIEEEIEDLFSVEIKKTLQDMGFNRYEISNYAKNGYTSKHNLAYWQYEDYFGVGSGAVGKVGSTFYTTLKNVYGFIKGNVLIDEEHKTMDELMFEHIMMSFRLVKGLDMLEFNTRYGVDFLIKFDHVIKKHQKYLIIEDGFVRCNELGLDCLHQILIDFL